MTYEKWHALGNVYLVVDRADAGAIDAGLAVRLCASAGGPGSDGVVEVVRTDGPTAEIVIWNPDGSTAEMSGNGVRIAACWLAGRTGRSGVTILTAGRRVAVQTLPGGRARATMGAVAVGDEESIDVGDAVVVTPVSVGNPHAVIRSDGATRDDLLRLGPRVERHERFPERTNVQLVEPLGLHDLRVLVWERGAGETSSSGSSAVAAAAVAVARGWCVSPVTVHLPGGELEVELSDGGAVLTGPAERLEVGELP